MIIVIANFENENFICWQIYGNKNGETKAGSPTLVAEFCRTGKPNL
jgi:hypothetical protein